MDRAEQAAAADRRSGGRAAVESLLHRLAPEYGLDRLLVRALVHVASSYPSEVAEASLDGLERLRIPVDEAADIGVPPVAVRPQEEARLRRGLLQLKRLLDLYGRPGPAVVAFAAGEDGVEPGGGMMDAETLRRTHQVLSEYLLAKGILPYSRQAETVLGFALTPEMAGSAGGPDSSPGLDQTRLLHIAEYSGQSSDVRPPSKLDTPVSRRSLEGTQRKSASRLSSRLHRPSNTLLQSRIFRPSAPARQAEQPSTERFVDPLR